MSEYEKTPIRVLIVDDHVLLRQGLCLMLNEQDNFEVVGEAGINKAALLLSMELQPDIVLLDIFLGSSNGLELASQLLRCCPKTRIVLFTGSDDEKPLFDALRIGVHGYLQKTLSIDDVRTALQAVQRGERVLGGIHTVTQVVNEFRRLALEEHCSHWGLSTGYHKSVPCLTRRREVR